jgi:deoxyribodipyrimidine photo-lyase
MSEAAEHFLEELVTWRELAYHWDAKHPEPYALTSLPGWALRTLEVHRADARPQLQSRDALERGTTNDALFNAAQRQLVRQGWFHNAARMVWGKKLLEYSASPESALALMAELMNTYSLDGRDPAGNAGMGWVLGRFDRPWGPERPIFGTVRYMSSTTPEKLRRFRDFIASQPPLP